MKFIYIQTGYKLKERKTVPRGSALFCCQNNLVWIFRGKSQRKSIQDDTNRSLGLTECLADNTVSLGTMIKF